MLSRTLATDYSPGLNLKHDLAGGSWTYLLPHLELEHVVCIGRPSRAALTTLLQISDSVTIVDHNPDAVDETHNESHKNSSKLTVVANLTEILLPGDTGADLVFVSGRGNVRQLYDDQRFQDELLRLMHKCGLIYFELEPMTRLLHRRGLKELGKRFGPHQLLWLTPWHGEVETAVPVIDRRMINHFFQHKLYSPSLNLSTLKHRLGWRKRARGRKSAEGPRKNQGTSLLQKVRASSRPLLRAVAAKTVNGLGRIERILLQGNHIMRRYGVFVQAHGAAGELQMDKPPSYLQSIASSQGIDISEHRWGFSARGRYSSRKLLFYLFKDQERGADDFGANFIVKMVRDSVYNARLENEYRALASLDDVGVRGKALLPKAEFFGYHNGLAVAGESYVDGVPFRAQTQATADCPYARDVVDWLTHLGAVTARASEATPEQLADAMEQLLSSFAELYCPSQEVYAFLANQVAQIGRFQGRIPLVFQHGDPGTWNIFVTKERRVAFLDWEAAEPQGMPLWDLFYFLRSYCTWVAQTGGTRDTLRGYREQFLSDGPLGQLVLEAIDRYCRQVQVPPEMVEPLFYTCWMHRALKQATSLPVDKLDGGHYVNLLRLTIEERENSYILQRLFSASDAINQGEPR